MLFVCVLRNVCIMIAAYCEQRVFIYQLRMFLDSNDFIIQRQWIVHWHATSDDKGSGRCTANLNGEARYNICLGLSAVAEMGDRLATINMGENWGRYAPSGGSIPIYHNISWAEAYLRTNGILIYPSVWPQYTNVTDIQTGQTGQRSDSIGEPFYKRRPKITNRKMCRLWSFRCRCKWRRSVYPTYAQFRRLFPVLLWTRGPCGQLKLSITTYVSLWC